jgi:hypothetical protein
VTCEKTLGAAGVLVGVLAAFVAFSLVSTTSTEARELQERTAVDSAAQAKVLYVSSLGNDSWSGTLPDANSSHTDGPLASLQGARNAVKQLKAHGPLTAAITVRIRQGKYLLTEPVIFGPEDSGTDKFPITYSAYPSEAPVISGGRAITGWKKSEREGNPDLFEAKVPATKDRECYFRQLFVNGQRRQRARSPNKGFFYVDGELTEDKYARFRYRDDNILPTWADRKGVEVMVLQSWTVMRNLITAVNGDTRTVTLSQLQVGQKDWGREKNARYWVENTFDALDSPGEWYLDRGTQILYYWPMPGEDMNRVQVVAPILGELVRFEGGVWGDEEPGRSGWPLNPVHDIHLVGLTFEHADWSMSPMGYTDKQGSFDVAAAVEAVGANSIMLEKNTFQNLGGYAIEFGKGCHANRIIRNEMRDLGAGGVKIGEPKVPNTDYESTTGNIISNNRIHDIGNVYPGTAGLWVGQSSGNTIAHNEIYNTYQTGIAIGWTWDFLPTAATDNVVELNNIHDIGRGMLGDMGCVYTVGVLGGVIRNNLCHDVTRFEGSYGGRGIYLDQGSTNVLVENNVVYRTQDATFIQNIANRNIVRNNIFALGNKAQITRQVHVDRKDRDWLTFDHNIVYWSSGVLLNLKWDDTNTTFNDEWENTNFKLDYNLYFNPNPRQVLFGKLSFAEWQKRGQDHHSIVADPLFVDPSSGNFTLRPDSPALRIGFKSIDLSTVGPTPEL